MRNKNNFKCKWLTVEKKKCVVLHIFTFSKQTFNEFLDFCNRS